MNYLSVGQPMAPIAEGFFPMGISKIGPNLFFIKARVKIPNLDPRKKPDDRRKQEQFPGTKTQAQDRYLQMKADLRGERRAPGTFGDLLAAYLEPRGTLTGSQASVYKTLTRDLGGVALADLGDALRRYYAILKASRSRRSGRPYSPAALNRPRTMVAAALNLAKASKVIVDNPLTKDVWPKAKEIPRDRFLDPIETIRLLNVVRKKAPHLLAILQFALLVPCRKSELVKMTKGDLDLVNNAIRVHNGTTKNDEGSWKPIPPEMVEYFRTIPADCPLLFFRKVRDQYRSLGDFKRAWATAKRLAGIRDLHFHDSRHVAATNLVAAGTPERAVMEIAGWKTNMLDTYWASSSRRALKLVRFPSGGGNQGATSTEGQGKTGNLEAERAVS